MAFGGRIHSLAVLESSTQRGCSGFASIVNEVGAAANFSLGRSPLPRLRGVAVLISLFRDEGRDNLAHTIDVTGQNIPPVTLANRFVLRRSIPLKTWILEFAPLVSSRGTRGAWPVLLDACPRALVSFRDSIRTM
jgi:hypothetical protein